MLPTGLHKPNMLSAIGRLTRFIGTRALDNRLEDDLNHHYGPGSRNYLELVELLQIGIQEGWACYEEISGPDYRRGRIAEPCAETGYFSVESGMLTDVIGNYHEHTTGEINMIVPVDNSGEFCGHGAGWQVFAPKTRHFPTVTGGKVTTLFLLPNGQIEYRTPPRL